MLPGQGDGGFAAAAAIDASLSPHAVAAGELDGAPGPELVAAAHDSTAVLVGNGLGGYGLAFTVELVGADAPVIADLDVDGRADLVLPLPSSTQAAIVRTAQSLEPLPPSMIWAGPNPTRAIAVDLTYDDRPDLVFTGTQPKPRHDRLRRRRGL